MDAFRSILPEDIALGICTLEEAPQVTITPEEVAISKRYTHPDRQCAFLAGRVAAQRAQRELRDLAEPVLRDENGAPAWPEAIHGSITHTDNYAFALVSKRGSYQCIGIDVESKKKTRSPHIAQRIASELEAQWIEDGEDKLTRLLMIFTAKEALYKALSPITDQELRFQSAELHWNESKHLFEADIKVELPGEILQRLPVHMISSGDLVGAYVFR